MIARRLDDLKVSLFTDKFDTNSPSQMHTHASISTKLGRALVIGMSPRKWYSFKAPAYTKMESAVDPVVLATITSALTLMAAEVAKGAASEAGKALWAQIKSMFGWAQDRDPSLADIAPEIARKLAMDSELAKKIVELLQAHPESDRQASTLVQKIDAEKVIIAREFKISGDFNM